MPPLGIKPICGYVSGWPRKRRVPEEIRNPLGNLMKDELGLYYYPQPGNVKAKVYVRKGNEGDIEFRLWEQEHPEVWERHPWLSIRVIEDAARLYREERNSASNPLRLYDLDVARALLREEEEK